MTREVRTRFAPSPTGFQHIGGIRTALFCFLFSRNQNGKFILRVEDTDQSRFVPGAEQYVVDSLTWAGITIDEGPAAGGAHGPYRQSERLHIYREYVDKLLQTGKAYYAFDTAEEIEAMKERMIKEGITAPTYNYTTRNSMKNSLTMSKEEVDNLLGNKDTHYAVRLKVEPGEEIHFYDEIRGDITINSTEIDDKIILKSDGFPTYHLANVVDDRLMEISHVFRGEEWVSSTPFHVLLYRAFGWQERIPKFIHLPLILKPEGQGKLSKRDGDKFGFPVYTLKWKNDLTQEKALGFKEFGYLPEGFVNFLAMLGWHPGTNEEIMSLERLAELFSIERIHKAGTRFDIAKAKWFNAEHIKLKSAAEVLPLVKQALSNKEFPVDNYNDEYITNIIELLRPRVSLINDFADEGWYFFKAPDYDLSAEPGLFSTEQMPLFLKAVQQELAGLEQWDADIIQARIKELVKKTGVKNGDAFKSLRFVLTGKSMGADLFKLADILGAGETNTRFTNFLNHLQSSKSGS